MNLYELTSDYLELLEMVDDPNVDQEVLADTIEGIEGMLEDKADNYAKLIRNLEAEQDALEKEAKRFKERADRRARTITQLKKNLQYNMDVSGKRDFSTEYFSFKIRKNPPSLVIDNEDMIPEEYWIAQKPKINNKALKDLLKEDALAMQGICHLEQGESLRIV